MKMKAKQQPNIPTLTVKGKMKSVAAKMAASMGLTRTGDNAGKNKSGS